MLDPAALRLTAALVHTVPSVTAVLTLDHGRPVVVGSDPRYLPDLSPCQLRRLVVDGARAARGLSWLAAVVSVELGGPEVTTVDEGVVRLGERPTPMLVFATLLRPEAVRDEMAAAGRALRAAGTTTRRCSPRCAPAPSTTRCST